MNIPTLCGRVRLMRPERLVELTQAARNAVSLGMKPEAATSTTDGRGLLWAMGGKPKRSGQKAVAVVPICGMIDQKASMWMEWFGGCSTDVLGATIDMLVADPDVKGIILDIDSPGGTIAGLREVSAKIYEARSAKPIVSVSNSEMCSAAYWIGSAASRIFVSPGAWTGSIGSWVAVYEQTKQLADEGLNVKVIRSQQSPFKAELLPYEEFTQEALDHEQQVINDIHDDFCAAVSKHRGVPVATVKADFGKGRAMDAKSAVACGMADKVATLETVVSRMLSGRLNLNSLNEPGAFDDEPVDWQGTLETERMMSQWRRGRSTATPQGL